MPRLTQAIVRLTLPVSVGAFALSLAAIALAFRAQAWFGAAFQTVVLTSASVGVFAGLGRFRAGQGMALLCVGGTILVAAALTDPSLLASIAQGGAGGSVPGTAGVPRWLIGAEVIAALVCLLGAGASVLLRRPGASAAYLARAFMTGLPLLVGLAALLLPACRAWLATLPGFIATMLALAGGLLGIGLISVCIHNAIRAFEVAGPLEAPPSDAIHTEASSSTSAVPSPQTGS